MLCSKPDVTKAKRHQNIIINFDVSVFNLKVHHTAKHTNILQNIPLMNNCSGGKLIFISAVLIIKSLTLPVVNPAPIKPKAAIIDPKKLPA